MYFIKQNLNSFFLCIYNQVKLIMQIVQRKKLLSKHFETFNNHA